MRRRACRSPYPPVEPMTQAVARSRPWAVDSGLMRRLRLVTLVCLSALAQAAPRNWAKAACEDDLDSCRESCTIAYGTDLESQGRLARCAQRCQEESERCTFKRFQAQRALNTPKPAPPAPPATAPSSTVAMPSAVPGVKPPSPPPPAAVREDDPWSVVKPAPPPEESAHLAVPPPSTAATDPGPGPRSPAVTAPVPPAGAARAPAHPADSVDVFLKHPAAPPTEALHVQPSPSHPAPAPAPLPPQKKDLSKWDPGALE